MKASLVELVMVMTLLILIGTTILTLIYAGAGAQARIVSQKDAQTDARIAMSYINVRLRQNDAIGKIDVAPIALTGQNAIVIRERSLAYAYDTWIFWYDGKIYECLTLPDTEPNVLDSFYIVDAEGFDAAKDEDGVITSTIHYTYDDAPASLSSAVYLRSGAW